MTAEFAFGAALTVIVYALLQQLILTLLVTGALDMAINFTMGTPGDGVAKGVTGE